MSKKNLGLFDSRIVQRSLDQGLITKDDLEKHMKSLPDETNNLETVSYESILEDEIILPKFPPLEAVENLE